jgi:putative glutamine amidotransferase
VAADRPVIGLTTRRVETAGRFIDVTEHEYVNAVVGARGVPHLLPVVAADLAEGALSAVDGLMLTGGGDIDPARFGQARSPLAGGIDDARDAFELALARNALGQALPVLGICRGCQLLNVALGGTLVQHVPEVTACEHLVATPPHSLVHPVRLAPGSRLAAVVGATDLAVNSIHHQAVDRLAPDLVAVGWAPDGIVEALELPGCPVLAVQWHPEHLLGDRRHVALFEWLVERATERRRAPCPSGPPMGRPREQAPK